MICYLRARFLAIVILVQPAFNMGPSVSLYHVDATGLAGVHFARNLMPSNAWPPSLQIRHTSGVICSPLNRQRCQELALPLMVPDNEDTHHTAFTVTVDLHSKHGTTTGISAEQRAATVRAIANPDMEKTDF